MAIAMQEEMQNFNRRLGSTDNPLILKIGIHAGPCISVTLNERADYFGTTVNTAARVEGLSQGNDIVFTESLLNQVKAIADAKQYSYQESVVNLKGLSEASKVFHLRITESTSLK